MDTGDLIDAVKAHRALEMLYKSDDGSRLETRVIHPHALYRTASGDLRLEAIQVSGATSGALPGWRDFELMRSVNIRILPAEFQPATDYNADSERYRHGLLASA